MLGKGKDAGQSLEERCSDFQVSLGYKKGSDITYFFPERDQRQEFPDDSHKRKKHGARTFKLKQGRLYCRIRRNE